MIIGIFSKVKILLKIIFILIEARNHYQRHEEQTMLISRSPSGPPATEVDIDEIGLENVDQSGQVTLPDGRKVILIQPPRVKIA